MNPTASNSELGFYEEVVIQEQWLPLQFVYLG